MDHGLGVVEDPAVFSGLRGGLKEAVPWFVQAREADVPVPEVTLHGAGLRDVDFVSHPGRDVPAVGVLVTQGEHGTADSLDLSPDGFILRAHSFLPGAGGTPSSSQPLRR